MAIIISSGIVKYPVLNEKEEQVATLIIDKNDSTLIDKMLELKKEADSIQAKFDKDYANIFDSIDATTEQMEKAMQVYNESAERIVEVSERLFGDGIIHDIYSVNYELNPDFVPSLDALSAVFDAFMPIITEIIGNNNAPKYSPAKKGSKSRKQIAQEI